VTDNDTVILITVWWLQRLLKDRQ